MQNQEALKVIIIGEKDSKQHSVTGRDSIKRNSVIGWDSKRTSVIGGDSKRTSVIGGRTV
jgi:hypothetical protein